MPFGLSLAPFWQQMMSVPIAAMFRQFGIYSWIHVDDLIAAHEDRYFLFVVTMYVKHLLGESGILLNLPKSSLLPSTKVEFLGAVWNQAGITRDLSVTNNCYKLIYRIFYEPITYKQAQMAAGFLNYYSAFAGTAYVFITFFLHHWDSMKSYPWLLNLLIDIFSFTFISFNSSVNILAKDTLPLFSIHCDASETGVAAVDLCNGRAFAYPVSYNKPIYVKEFEA